MVSKQNAALSLPNLKIAKTYFANISLIISCSITIKAPALDCKVYVPHSFSLTSFIDSTFNTPLDSVKFNDNNIEGYKHQFSSKLITFNSSEATKSFLVQLLVDIVMGKKTHHFHSRPPPDNSFWSASLGHGFAQTLLSQATETVGSGNCPGSFLFGL